MASEKSKTVDMGNAKKPEQYSKEQLEKIVDDLQKQCRQLYSQLMNANQIISEFNEIDMLLNILDKSEHFHEEFVERCSNKIEEIISMALDNAEKQKEESKTQA